MTSSLFFGPYPKAIIIKRQIEAGVKEACSGAADEWQLAVVKLAYLDYLDHLIYCKENDDEPFKTPSEWGYYYATNIAEFPSNA